MRTGRPKAALIVTDVERSTLEGLARRARTAPQVARRARIVLACARGLDNQTVAKKLRVSAQTVGRWRARFVARRVDGLFDEPRPGVPRSRSDSAGSTTPLPTWRSSMWWPWHGQRRRLAPVGAAERWPRVGQRSL